MQKNKIEKIFYYEKLPLSAEQQKNIDIIYDKVVYDNKYPYLKQILGTYKRGLVSVLTGFIRCYDSLRNADIDSSLNIDNLVYRYIYLEHLIEFTGVHKNKRRKKEKKFNRKGVWSTKINILCVLGLIYKLDINKISSKDSYKIRKSREKRTDRIEMNGIEGEKARYVKNVNYFAVPSYDIELNGIERK